MSVKEVSALRKAGRIEEAYTMAVAEIEKSDNEWTKMSLFWVLREMCKNDIEKDNFEEAEEKLQKMQELLPEMHDENGVGKRAFNLLKKQARPLASLIASLSDLSKTNPTEAYTQATEKFGENAENLQQDFHEAYAWIIYRYLKSNLEKLTSKEVRTLLKNYLKLNNPKPSIVHSTMLGIAVTYTKEHPEFNFINFMKIWDEENFREEDLKGKTIDGKEFKSLAQKAAKRCFDFMKANNPSKFAVEDIQWLNSLHEKVLENEKDEWTLRNLATINLWLGNKEKAAEIYKKLLLDLSDKFYVWAELADCIDDDDDLKTGLLLKAKRAERNEDFIGDIHLELAKQFVIKGFKQEAANEIKAYADNRAKNKWSLNDTFRALSDAIAKMENNDTKPNYPAYIEKAENFAFGQFEWQNFILADKWDKEHTEYCKFIDGKDMAFTLKTKRFPIIKKAKIGDILKFKFNGAPQHARPLAIAKTGLQPWSILPIEYGVVEYDNAAKKTLHIKVKDAETIYYKYEENKLKKGCRVSFRRYTEKRKDKTFTRLKDLKQCTEEEGQKQDITT